MISAHEELSFSPLSLPLLLENSLSVQVSWSPQGSCQPCIILPTFSSFRSQPLLRTQRMEYFQKQLRFAQLKANETSSAMICCCEDKDASLHHGEEQQHPPQQKPHYFIKSSLATLLECRASSLTNNIH